MREFRRFRRRHASRDGEPGRIERELVDLARLAGTPPIEFFAWWREDADHPAVLLPDLRARIEAAAAGTPFADHHARRNPGPLSASALEAPLALVRVENPAQAAELDALAARAGVSTFEAFLWWRELPEHRAALTADVRACIEAAAEAFDVARSIIAFHARRNP